MMHPITTGPIGSWKGTVDRFDIIRPRHMNVSVAYTHNNTEAVSMIMAMRRGTADEEEDASAGSSFVAPEEDDVFEKIPALAVAFDDDNEDDVMAFAVSPTSRR